MTVERKKKNGKDFWLEKKNLVAKTRFYQFTLLKWIFINLLVHVPNWDVLFRYFGDFFESLLIGQLKDWTDNKEKERDRERVREGITCSKGQQGGIKPMVTAARTQPLHKKGPLYQLRHQRTPKTVKYRHIWESVCADTDISAIRQTQPIISANRYIGRALNFTIEARQGRDFQV